MSSVLKKIDCNGRLVLPYTMRNAVGLSPNQNAQIELSGSMLIVSAPANSPSVPRVKAAPFSQSLLACLSELDNQKIALIMDIANRLKIL